MSKNRTKIINYAGMTESMGAVFSVLYGKDRVIMDFGSGFNPNRPNYIKHDDNWINEKLDLGILPKIDGIYPKKYLKYKNLKSYEECDYNTAIFTSHLHLDHMGNIGAVSKEIPVYLSSNAIKIEKALEELNMGVDTIGRDYQEVEDRRIIQVGEISVLPIMNSPYSYNMYGYLIKTKDMKIGYIADFSLCNECPEKVFTEMEIFKNEKIDLLYCDNCNFDDYSLEKFYGSLNLELIKPSLNIPFGMVSYDDHMVNVSKHFKNVKGLVVFNHYEREMHDVELIEKWAKEENRELVLEAKSGYLVYKFFNKEVSIYDEEIFDEKWYKELRENCKIITKEEIIQNPNKYCINISYRNIEKLEELQIKDSVYIHAEGDPFNYEKIKELKEYVEKCGYSFRSYDDPTYYQHGYPNHVKYFVDYVNPKVVIGYHGKHPERILAKDGYNLVPELYATYIYENNRLIKE